MARTGVSKTQIKKARDLLLSQGRRPSADAIRNALGDTGSKTTIHRYLKELEKEEHDFAGQSGKAVGAARDFVDQLEKLRADVDRRIDELRDQYEQSLRQKDQQLEELENEINELLRKLGETTFDIRSTKAEVNAEMEVGRRKRHNYLRFDHRFNNLFDDCRNGGQMQSPFSAIRSTTRSEAANSKEFESVGFDSLSVI